MLFFKKYSFVRTILQWAVNYSLKRHKLKVHTQFFAFPFDSLRNYNPFRSSHFPLLLLWDWVHSVRRSTFGPFYQHRMMDNDECGAAGEMFARGNQSTWRETTTVPLCPPQIPHDLTRARTRVTNRTASGNPHTEAHLRVHFKLKWSFTSALLSYKPWTHVGNRCSSTTLYPFGTTWRWMVSFTPRPLCSWGKISVTHLISG
jgi:hypothetical protein